MNLLGMYAISNQCKKLTDCTFACMPFSATNLERQEVKMTCVSLYGTSSINHLAFDLALCIFNALKLYLNCYF